MFKEMRAEAMDHIKLAKYYATLRADVVSGANSFLPVVIQDLLDGPGRWACLCSCMRATVRHHTRDKLLCLR